MKNLKSSDVPERCSTPPAIFREIALISPGHILENFENMSRNCLRISSKSLRNVLTCLAMQSEECI